MKEDAILGLVLISGKDLVEGCSIETNLELSDHGLIQFMLNCKREKCRSLSKAWNHRTANLEKWRKFVRLTGQRNPKMIFTQRY